MKKLFECMLCFFIILLVGEKGLAQSDELINAKKDFFEGNYEQVIRRLVSSQVKTSEGLYLLAKSYAATNNNDKALHYFNELFNTRDYTGSQMIDYIFFLRNTGKYDQMYKWSLDYKNRYITDSRIDRIIENFDLIDEIKESNSKIVLRNLGVNTSDSEFGANYFKDQIVFTSSNDFTGEVKGKKRNNNDKSYLDLFVASKGNDGELYNILPFSNKINQKYHEGPACFSSTGNMMILTRNNYKNSKNENTINLELFISYNDKGTWSSPTPLTINNSNYSVGHPTLGNDDKMIIFASNMPGGFGGTDLYKSTLQPDGNWQEPVNLGNKINTEGNELFPFMHPSGILFFSSDGHFGLGGLDVFSVQFFDEIPGEIKNLGAPINSTYDDFSFIIDDQFQSGYFSSNRIGGRGSDDIYHLTIDNITFVHVEVIGVTKDNSFFIVPEVDIKVVDSDNKVISVVKSDEFGNFKLRVPAKSEYQIIASKANYQQTQVPLIILENEKRVTVDIVLNEIP